MGAVRPTAPGGPARRPARTGAPASTNGSRQADLRSFASTSNGRSGSKRLAAAHYHKVIEFTQQRPGLTDPVLVANFERMVDELDPPSGT